MNIHEYQAKEILQSYDIATLKGRAAFSVDEAVAAAESLGGALYVVKAQIHAGGRGKAGGVKLARSLDEVKAHASELLGKVLVTHQTGPQGKKVNRLFIEEGCAIDKEYYLGFVLDRSTSRVVMMGSAAGGMDIEEVSAKTPEKIFKETIDPLLGLTEFQARRMAFAMEMPKALIGQAVKIMMNLYRVYLEKDCSIVEINPLVTTKDDKVLALDAKLNFDDSALYRHPEIEAYRDLDEEDAKEMDAAEYGLNYVTLDGSIACMVNGAGLAMATIDIIKHYGGEPANFLDVGGSSNVDKIAAAFKIILSDKKVKGIFVNIFGGINKCDVIAAGVIEAAKKVGLSVPTVVRLEGTNVELGRELLDSSGVNVVKATSMDEGAQKIVSLVG